MPAWPPRVRRKRPWPGRRRNWSRARPCRRRASRPTGEVFTLAGDAFGSGQAQLTADAAASVRALGLYLKAIGAGSVQVLGHTDSQGEAEANRALSQRRADAVQAALVAAGIGRARTRADGRGEDAPVADNLTAAGRAQNRRVEIVVAN
ncbi:MAG: OmpA family protein [Thermomonas sp.]|nr:OmpA family protein [Thermomonas sp.]